MTDGLAAPLRVVRWSELDEHARERLLRRGLEEIFDPDLRRSITALIEDIRENGDAGVSHALKRFDGCEVSPQHLRVDPEEMASAARQVSPALRRAVRAAIENVRAYNEHLSARREWRTELRPGVVVGEQATPIASAGLFVPCGKGSFPSVLVQVGTPAVVAGVPELTVIVPPKPGTDGLVDPAVLYVAQELGLERVLRANGPAGVAAVALGTETFPAVRKVVGPGSPAVQLAQIECQRYGCHTHMLLGPTEAMIVADDSADIPVLAADLLNEAEHGPDSAAILVTDSSGLADRLSTELSRQLDRLPEPRRSWARTAMTENGGAVLVEDMSQALEVANLYAPEHMQLAVRDPEAALARVEHAGEVLLGQQTPLSAANYLIGVPAALPTGGFARVTGGVTAETFLKRASIARLSPEALDSMAPEIVALAEHEGFPAHAEAVRLRAGQDA